MPTLDRAFTIILQMTMQAGALVVLVLVAQWLFGHWMPPLRHALWMLVALRLAMPVLPSAPWSLFNLAPKYEAATAASVAPIAQSGPTIKVIYGEISTGAVGNLPQPTETVTPAPAIPPKPISWFSLAAIFWAMVAFTLALRLIVRGARFARRVRSFNRIEDPRLIDLLDETRHQMYVRSRVDLLAATNLPGPAFTGMIRPKILLPGGVVDHLDDNEFRFIFLHELAHLKRRDILIDWLIAILQTLHWFNPLIWFAMSRRRAERELVCDAMVLSICGRGQRRRYGGAIVKLIEHIGSSQPAPLAVGIVESKRQLTRRITMIAGFRRSSVGRSMLAACVIVAIALFAMTDAHSAEPKPADPPAAKHTSPTDPLANAGLAEATTKPDSAESEAIVDTMPIILPEVNFDATGFSDVIDFLRDVTGANIFVNWRALEEAGIDRNTPVTARLRNVKFSKALNIILANVRNGNARCGFAIDEGVITISTGEEIGLVGSNTRTYDVRDLLVVIPDEPLPKQSAGGATTRPNVTREQLVQSLRSLITATVAPESWTDAGGNIGQISELQGQFIITQSEVNHKSIANLLAQIRETKGLQIAIEARFIVIDDAVISALPPELRRKVGGAMRVDADDSKDIASTLIHEELKQLLAVTAGNKESTILTAPRLTLFNGQQAYVCITRAQSYISDFTMTKTSAGEIRYEPRTATVDPGIVFEVSGIVSSDRTSVALNLHPSLTTLLGLESIPYVGAPNEKLQVQKPNVKVSELNTRMSVPSGGTVLLGGLSADASILGDSAKDSGKPLLLLVNARVIVPKPAEATPLLSSKPEK